MGTKPVPNWGDNRQGAVKPRLLKSDMLGPTSIWHFWDIGIIQVPLVVTPR